MIRRREKFSGKAILGGGVFATPGTYTVDGKQFVIVPVSDDLNPEETTEPGPYRIGDFVAFALPG